MPIFMVQVKGENTVGFRHVLSSLSEETARAAFQAVSTSLKYSVDGQWVCQFLVNEGDRSRVLQSEGDNG